MSVLQINQGDDETLTIVGRDAAGALQDLTDLDLYFVAKRSAFDSDASAVISKSTAGGITIDADQVANKGKATITIAAADTRGMPSGPSLPWSLTAVDGPGKTTTLASGQLVIVPAVRRGGS
jgi:hypothetical protein